MKQNLILLLTFVLMISCKKEFLDKKPASNLTVPKTLSELQGLLENTPVMNLTGALGQVSSDEYIIPDYASYLALPELTSKNAYLWNMDLYSGETGIRDWNHLYRTVFYANNVLDILKQNIYSDTKLARKLKGWALFARAYAFYNLASNFCPVYDTANLQNVLGIPLRLSGNIDYLEQRSSLAKSFEQIISDANAAIPLLDPTVIYTNPYRPSKAGAFGFLSRMYLYMGNYEKAENAADSCLRLHSKLIDYNKISQTAQIPFGFVTDETIYFSTQVEAIFSLTAASSAAYPYSIEPGLLASFGSSDLRSTIFFKRNPDGTVNSKSRYTGDNYPFTGIATDEVMLIKAECLARRGDYNEAIKVLNTLLITRFKSGSYVALSASSAENALNIVLAERRKELVWRGQRWPDLKRLNREGRAIVLSRKLNGIDYRLTPNDNRYTFPIPPEEIQLSGIEQNRR